MDSGDKDPWYVDAVEKLSIWTYGTLSSGDVVGETLFPIKHRFRRFYKRPS